jgi:hypothetical protein
MWGNGGIAPPLLTSVRDGGVLLASCPCWEIPSGSHLLFIIRIWLQNFGGKIAWKAAVRDIDLEMGQ